MRQWFSWVSHLCFSLFNYSFVILLNISICVYIYKYSCHVWISLPCWDLTSPRYGALRRRRGAIRRLLLQRCLAEPEDPRPMTGTNCIQLLHCFVSVGGFRFHVGDFLKWGHPNSWMVCKGKYQFDGWFGGTPPILGNPRVSRSTRSIGMMTTDSSNYRKLMCHDPAWRIWFWGEPWTNSNFNSQSICSR